MQWIYKYQLNILWSINRSLRFIRGVPFSVPAALRLLLNNNLLLFLLWGMSWLKATLTFFVVHPDFFWVLATMLLDMTWSPLISVIPLECGISQKLLVTKRDVFHHLDPWPPEDCVVRELYIDHIGLRDNICTYQCGLGVRLCQANASRFR